MLELPHTPTCLVCGPHNPHGLHLILHVDEHTGIVTTRFTPTPNHVGFEGIIHGGILATVVDEAMVWAATWSGQRFCVCGELNTRFRQSAQPGIELTVTAQVIARRSRLIETEARITDPAGQPIATATAKYVPLSEDRHTAFIATFIEDPTTQLAADHLRRS